MGRPVSLGEVYIKTHTKKDGTYVDLKAEQVAEIYKKNKEAKLTALEAENSQSSDGASNDRQLSIEEDTEIFLLVSCLFQKKISLYTSYSFLLLYSNNFIFLL